MIVHHRGKRLLSRCLQALLASVGVDLRVVVVANACDEPLPEEAGDDRVYVVPSQRSLGFSAANNLGAAWAGDNLPPAEFLFFVNNDALAEPQALELLTTDLRKHAECAIVGPRLMIWGAPGIVNSLGLNLTRTGEAWDEGIGRPLAEYPDLPSRRPVTAVTGAAIMVRRETFEALAGWDDLYAFYFEDIDLALRARAAGGDVVVVTESVMHHAISATAARGSDLKRQLSWRNRFLLMMIHWPWRLLVPSAARTARGELGRAWRRLRAGARADVVLQVRSWLGAVRRLPAALARRWRRGSDSSWTRTLRPHGSVPVIKLPELPEDASDAAPGASTADR